MITFKGIAIDRTKRTISHRGVTRDFNMGRHYARFKLLVFFLLAGGASKEMAFWHLYADDPEGGPESGEKCVQVMMTQSTEWHLRKLGLEFRSWRIAGVSFYEIVPIYELPVPGRFSYGGMNISVKTAGMPIGSLELP